MLCLLSLFFHLLRQLFSFLLSSLHNALFLGWVLSKTVLNEFVKGSSLLRTEMTPRGLLVQPYLMLDSTPWHSRQMVNRGHEAAHLCYWAVLIARKVLLWPGIFFLVTLPCDGSSAPWGYRENKTKNNNNKKLPASSSTRQPFIFSKTVIHFLSLFPIFQHWGVEVF